LPVKEKFPSTCEPPATDPGLTSYTDTFEKALPSFPPVEFFTVR